MGFPDPNCRGADPICCAGRGGARLDAANFAQVRREVVARGSISDAEVHSILERLAAPEFAVFSPVMFTAWGDPRDRERPDFGSGHWAEVFGGAATQSGD